MYDLTKPELDDRDVVDAAQVIELEDHDPESAVNGDKELNLNDYLQQVQLMSTNVQYFFLPLFDKCIHPHRCGTTKIGAAFRLITP